MGVSEESAVGDRAGGEAAALLGEIVKRGTSNLGSNLRSASARCITGGVSRGPRAAAGEAWSRTRYLSEKEIGQLWHVL